MRRRWISIARGAEPADLVLAGGEVLSVFTGEIFRADVAIADGHIVGVGDYQSPISVDVTGKLLIPGLIDGHCHIESAKLNVDEFARAVLPAGTTSIVVDPHEIANVLGVRGIEYMLEASHGLPLGVYVMLPSCVPASRFESAAQPVEAYDFPALLARDRVIGIAEMMNYPGVLAAEPSVLDKMALTGYDRIDGHAPGLTGRDLNAYLVAGPTSDHECTSLAEALEKRRLGMWIMIREASMIRNLLELLPLVQQYGTENCMFVTDDREASTLLSEGHMNAIVRKAVKHGLALGDAVKLASLNVARYHGLPRRGAIAPGYAADIVVLPNAVDIKPDLVYRDGRLVARGGEALPFPSPAVPDDVLNTVHARTVSAKSFAIPDSGSPNIRVIDLVQDQVITRAGLAKACGANGALRADGARDLAKVAVVERHHETGRVGVAFVRGFGLREGAFASTVAHDAHNIVVVGIDDEDMALCVERLAMLGGGLTVARSGRIVDEMRLEIAGLMSTQPARAVASTLARLELRLCEMGVSIATPFMYLSFLALSVIPELRITDHGLVDVRTFELVPVGVG